MPLAKHQIERYARHILLREIGGAGQTRLLAASARVTGHGLAAEEAATYLAAAGVGRLVLADALADRLAPRLRALNEDVTVATTGDADRDVVPATPDRRADGAMAALSAVLVLAGVAPTHSWTTSPLEASPWQV